MTALIGWDIGGANVKAARLAVDPAGPGRPGSVRVERSVSVPFALWRDPGRLPAVLAGLAAELGRADAHAVTMTAELADVFPTRREGVLAVLAAVEEALGPGAPIHVWTTRGRFCSPPEARGRPLEAAAANWVATAAWLAGQVPACLLVDVGSTTADIIPIVGGRVAAAGWDDPSRLATGELVYTGVLRTPVATLADAVPIGGRWARLAAETFAVTGDVHVALGHLAPEAYAGETPDGRGRDRRSCLARLARAVCADLETLAEAQVLVAARFLAQAQAHRIAAAVLQVLSRLAGRDGAAGPLPVIGTGLGRFLARDVAGWLGLPYRDLDDLLAAGEQAPEGGALARGQAAPAAAVAALLAQHLAGGARRPDRAVTGP
ncbi:hydantoinase/oxoprolinase family protein [Caldinitratiruptor microaerophilus]|uniref:Hydantoinase A/oxoprolinase domain-containing protein n=1 Tax=Caldinitratiruptor microaerophilus TaxID=671077 RepID=A0AA35CL65_9FIRM|nr:hydantoinase/oxoprolinase family protein [Caldinitratiruptor microaerophilus]BDG60448.1 hypothetical protein caldi_15380 [Caldinitratiruptor microaerophilus]